jgi:hypothetical protein
MAIRITDVEVVLMIHEKIVATVSLALAKHAAGAVFGLLSQNLKPSIGWGGGEMVPLGGRLHRRAVDAPEYPSRSGSATRPPDSRPGSWRS